MTADELLRLHMGNLMVQIITLQAENESLKKELASRPEPDTKPETQ